jgi:hypothetical protein
MLHFKEYILEQRKNLIALSPGALRAGVKSAVTGKDPRLERLIYSRASKSNPKGWIRLITKKPSGEVENLGDTPRVKSEQPRAEKTIASTERLTPEQEILQTPGFQVVEPSAEQLAKDEERGIVDLNKIVDRRKFNYLLHKQGIDPYFARLRVRIAKQRLGKK